jgi:outer membrane protein assembly factor BamB
MTRHTLAALLLALAIVPPGAAQPVNGWRGNGTGLWPDADPPLVWQRAPRGVVPELRCRADRPGVKASADDAAPFAKGLVREWLVLGPIAVADSVQDFGKSQLPDEANVQPAAGDKVGSLAWTRLAAQIDDPFAFGPADIPWSDLAPTVGGYRRNQVAYVHTYLFTPTGGTVRAVVDHAHGLAAWVNGKEVYRAKDRAGGLGVYYTLSRVELSIYDLTVSPRFDVELKPGWNRLLLKVGTYNKDGWTEHHFCLRLMDLPTVGYDSKNIRWMTELPHRSNATPILAGNRLFVMAEPDELLCVDKDTGKVLWTAANNYYEALTPAERAANPAFRTRIEPLLAKLKQERDFIGRQKLRTKIQRALQEIDEERFAWKADGHFEGHFGIVGFTTPTPVSDGKHVWVWCGNGVAACYDLDGKRRWIKRIQTRELSYASSPALVDGVLAVYLNRLVGLDANTGEVRWEQKKININNGAVLAATLAGVPVFVSQRGHIARAKDGKLLHREANPGGDTGWAPPVILGDVVYQPNYGVNQLNVIDFTGVSGDEWAPKRTTIEVETVPLPGGKRVDRWTAGSPLVVGDLAYLVDIYGTFYAVDLKARKTLFREPTALRGLFHYNALPVAASPTLVGKHIVIQDNQGLALVLEPGRVFKQVSGNRIATQLDRYWPVPAQETIGYAPPVADGDRLYLRGERYLYCIGGMGE